MKKLISLLIILILAFGTCMPVPAEPAGTDSVIPYRFASAEEGKQLKMANREYFEKITPNKLGFIMHDDNATPEDYMAFTKQQVLDWTDAEKKLIDDCIEIIERSFIRNGWKMPPLETIVFIRTTMLEENGAFGYTHGTQIYLSSMLEQYAAYSTEQTGVPVATILAHELFHCLTRCNPGFRKDMYSIIHFTVTDQDYELPPSVLEYYIANPDVEHHNSYATFLIDGKETDCFTAFATTKHAEKPEETFMDFGVTALVPTDGTDTWYTVDRASNFNEIFGTNTGYVIDPEECLADNFSYAVIYGEQGPEGKGYPNPEIIEAIMSYLSGK